MVLIKVWRGTLIKSHDFNKVRLLKIVNFPTELLILINMTLLKSWDLINVPRQTLIKNTELNLNFLINFVIIPKNN